MEAKGVFHVVKNALLPSPKDERAVRMFAAGALQLGDKVFITVHRARNPEFNAKAHIVFRKIGEAIGQSEDVIKLWLKWETGRVDLVRLPTGKHIPNPRSFAFESMGEDEFQAFWKDALEIVKEKILPEISEEDFEGLRRVIVGDTPSIVPEAQDVREAVS